MAALLEKIRAFRYAASPRSGAERKPSSADSRFFWAACILSGIAVLAVFFWTTSAKILKDPIRINYGPTDPAFASALGPVVGAEFVDGNKVQLLVNGDSFFPAMLKEIKAAKKTITFETYIWAPGKISEDFIFALMERARNGVKVHVLVDGMGTLKFTDDDRDRLREAGVEMYKYGREHWWEVKPNINHRTHRKILVIDGAVGFTGGMCIDDKWAGNADNNKVWRETMVRVEGPVVRQMQAAFATNWLQTTSHILLGEEYFPKIKSTGSVLAQCYKSGPGEGPEYVRLGYLFAIAAARKSIDISNAYFVPDDLAIDMLVAARQRGVKVRVVMPAKNDSRFGRAAARSRLDKLLAAGVEFYRFEPAMFHPKTMSVDDVLVTIGSANFDNRSFAINDEVTMNILDPRIAADHKRMFEGDIKNSMVYSREEHEARPLYIKACDQLCGLFRSQF
ncbi:MAG: cardiolipin synthase [Verrucomicrobiota bacterium]